MLPVVLLCIVLERIDLVAKNMLDILDAQLLQQPLPFVAQPLLQPAQLSSFPFLPLLHVSLAHSSRGPLAGHQLRCVKFVSNI